MMKKMMKKLFKSEKGLTLIELLAVIVILGIIAAIAVPAIGGIINKTKDDALKAEGVQIISAAKMHMAANALSTTEVSGSGRTLQAAELMQYLDNVKDSSFTVEVTSNASGKYTYVLQDHDAETKIGGSDGLTETELGIQ